MLTGGERDKRSISPDHFCIWEADFVLVVFSGEKRSSGGRSEDKGNGRPALAGNVSALVLLASAVQHTNAVSRGVAVIGAQRSHVRPIKELFKYMFAYLFEGVCICIRLKNYTCRGSFFDFGIWPFFLHWVGGPGVGIPCILDLIPKCF